MVIIIIRQRNYKQVNHNVLLSSFYIDLAITIITMMTTKTIETKMPTLIQKRILTDRLTKVLLYHYISIQLKYNLSKWKFSIFFSSLFSLISTINNHHHHYKSALFVPDIFKKKSPKYHYFQNHFSLELLEIITIRYANTHTHTHNRIIRFQIIIIIYKTLERFKFSIWKFQWWCQIIFKFLSKF